MMLSNMDFQTYISVLEVSGLLLIALISPGPDFAVIVRNSLVYSRKVGLMTALGIALGSLLHVSYTLFGLGLIIRESSLMFLMVKFLGAAYLFYIGYLGLRAKKTGLALGDMQQKQEMSSLSALGSGFLTNALNPKAMLFFISLFSVVIPSNMPLSGMFLCGLIIFLETLVWFSFVAFCLSGKRTREKFNAVSHWIERLMGGILISLGLKLIFTV